MFAGISRNNRLFMVANFLFAFSYGLWMNLRQLHLDDLGAPPVEVGTVLGIISLAVGTLVAAMATTWQMAGVGFAVCMLVIAANPATVSLVLLYTRNPHVEGEAERVMATVFASWPAAMIFAPALGGSIADRFGIGADLWIGLAGLLYERTPAHDLRFIVGLIAMLIMLAVWGLLEWHGILKNSASDGVYATDQVNAPAGSKPQRT